jgi:hypothetical protein
MNITPSEEQWMNALQKKLEHREKTKLIAMIQQMLRQEPDVQWLLTTPLPTSSSQKVSLDPEVYRQQVLSAMVVGSQLRKYKHHEVQRRLLALKTFGCRGECLLCRVFPSETWKVERGIVKSLAL